MEHRSSGNEPKAKATRVMEKHWPNYEKELLEREVLPALWTISKADRSCRALRPSPRFARARRSWSCPCCIAWSPRDSGEVRWNAGNKFMADVDKLEKFN